MSRRASSLESAAGLPETDSALLALVEQRDEQAMAVLFQRHSKLVYAIALRVLRDQALAEDVLQEVFMQIWRSPARFNSDRGTLQPLLTVMSRNRSIDVLRKRKPVVTVDELSLESPFDFAADSERNLLLERVRAVTTDLPSEQRKALEMAFFEGMTHQEISDRTGNPLGTVKTRIRSALLTLGKAFKA